jgi:hypothetical protein
MGPRVDAPGLEGRPPCRPPSESSPADGTAPVPPRKRGETKAHRQLKRLAVLWAQAQGYSACAVEVTLPSCRYRADVAAYRARGSEPGITAIFECKQVRSDLRRDNCCSSSARERLATVQKRRQVLEKHLRVHHPTLRAGESLFPEFDAHDFGAIEHRSYARVVRELGALQKRLHGGTKFECLTRYRCANLFFLVVPNELYHEAEVPLGWGALVQSGGSLDVRVKPAWHDNSAENRLKFLQRIAAAGTRHLNRQLEISFDLVQEERKRAV